MCTLDKQTHTAQVRSARIDAKRDCQAVLQLVDFGQAIDVQMQGWRRVASKLCSN